MNPTLIIGILLIIIGIVSFAYLGITVTRDSKIIDIGPIEVHKQTKERIPIPPIVGGIALVGGILLVLAGKGKS